MEEHPIIFSGPMVRAILKGQKTQTRRVVKPQPNIIPVNGVIEKSIIDRIRHLIKCPYGQVGDRLWVRETWYNPEYEQGESGLSCDCYYKASDDVIVPWRPSIHMPRWASRITLEITNIRVERLQDITEGEAKNEGVIPYHLWPYEHQHRREFMALWNSINGKTYPWESNPWVWVIEFKRTQ